MYALSAQFPPGFFHGIGGKKELSLCGIYLDVAVDIFESGGHLYRLPFFVSVFIIQKRQAYKSDQSLFRSFSQYNKTDYFFGKRRSSRSTANSQKQSKNHKKLYFGQISPATFPHSAL